MLTEADDEGRLVAEASWLRAVILPWHPTVSVERVDQAVADLAGRGLIRLYTVEGVQYAEFPSWRHHQYINRPAASILPACPESYEHSVKANGPNTERSDLNHEGRKEGRKEGTEGAGEAGGTDCGERTDAVETGGGRNGSSRSSDTATKPPLFRIPASVQAALDRAPILGQVARLRDPSWWQAELRANPSVNLAEDVLRAEAWITSNP